MPDKRTMSAVLFVVLFLPCLSCRMNTESILVGVWRMESPCATVKLVVSRDHSFVQSVRTASGQTNLLKGTWRVSHLGSSGDVADFEPFLDFREEARGTQVVSGGFSPDVLPRGFVMGPIIAKCPNSDHEIDYVKDWW